MTSFYAGIGSRETPDTILYVMRRAARALAMLGKTLRSGGADGADAAFEEGCNSVKGGKQIFIPWDGFNNRTGLETGVYPGYSKEASELAKKYHPNWNVCSRGARGLHSRNMHQILGPNLNEPVRFVICWTPNASGGGGTGQALRLARDYSIPIYDLADQNCLNQVIEGLNIS